MNIWGKFFKKSVEEKELSEDEFNEDENEIERIELSEDILIYVKKYLLDESHGGFRDIISTDTLFEDCARCVVQTQSGSTSMLQRKFNLGYNRAGRIIDLLEIYHIVGPTIGSSPKEVLVKTEVQLEKILHGKFSSDFYEKNKEEIESLMRIYIDTYEEKKSKQEQMRIEIEKEQIRQKILEKERKKQLRRDVYKELQENGKIFNNSNKRDVIPQEIMDAVWNRDQGKCVLCGTQENLEFDHIIPFSKGGANTYRNLQILCKECNLKKSNKIG